MHIIQQLELDEKQIQQYEQLIQRHRATIHLLEAEITRTKKRLMQTLIVEKSEAYADSLTSKIGHLQQEIERAHLLHFQQIHALCKPNQQVKFQQLVAELDAIFGPKKPPHRMKDWFNGLIYSGKLKFISRYFEMVKHIGFIEKLVFR